MGIAEEWHFLISEPHLSRGPGISELAFSSSNCCPINERRHQKQNRQRTCVIFFNLRGQGQSPSPA
jgi:hypothetical protein